MTKIDYNEYKELHNKRQKLLEELNKIEIEIEEIEDKMDAAWYGMTSEERDKIEKCISFCTAIIER